VLHSTRILCRLLRRTRGASYSLPFVLVVPLYLTVMLTAVEAGFLLLARIGTQYAAHAAARSAVVWRSASPAELREDRVRQSAAQALAPFVGGRQRELDSAGPVPPWGHDFATDFADAVRRFEAPAAAADPCTPRPYQRSRTPPEADFLRRKFLCAAARTSVEVVATDPADPRTALTVTVRFRAPLYVPVVSRFLDPDGSPPFEYPMSATVTLPADGAMTATGTVGIDYHSFPLAPRP
jgi:Flp pilus assembly protein TadG